MLSGFHFKNFTNFLRKCFSLLEKFKKNLFISIAAAAVIYLALTIYADFDSVLQAFRSFNWLLLPLLLLLSFLNYISRFFKWHYYLNLLKINIRFKDSMAIFFSGLIMSVTPGKMGELIKSYMVKQISEDPISKTAPIILTERITDFISLVFLALAGAYIFDYGKAIVIGTGVFFIVIIYLISHKRLALKVIDILTSWKLLSKFSVSIRTAYESSYTMLKPKPLFLMFILSLISWFFECFGFYLILKSFSIDVTLIWPTFAYSFATIAGSITMLPAGLGVTEGSLTFLMIGSGIAKNIAVTSTFILRVVTLWFAVLCGIVSLLFYQKRFGKISFEKS